MVNINKKLLKFIGLFLFFLVIFNLYLHYKNNDYVYSEFLWFCNIAAIFLFIGIIKENSKIITAVFLAASIGQLLWITDFLSLFIFGSGSGRTNWLLQSEPIIFWVSTSLHASLIPISILGLLTYGFSKKSFLFTWIVFGLILLPLSFYTTPQSENINCVFYPCDLIFENDLNKITSSGLYLGPKYLIYNLGFWTFNLIIYFSFCKFILRMKKVRDIIKTTD